MNLLCPKALPGAGDLDVDGCLKFLDEMAARVRTETERYHNRFVRNSTEFENSEALQDGDFAVVLAEDFQVKYAPIKWSLSQGRARMTAFSRMPMTFSCTDAGHTAARHISSLPVLHVTVGRGLGYPLKLVTTKGHLLCVGKMPKSDSTSRLLGMA